MTERLVMPQQVTRIAPVGSLLKSSTAFRVKPSKFERAQGERAPKHLICVRQLPCLKCGLEPCGEAAHVRMNCVALGKRNAMSAKPGDAWTVPLCRACHQNDPDSQHKVGEAVFWNDIVKLNPLLIAKELYARTGDLVAMRAFVFTAIAERGVMRDARKAARHERPDSCLHCVLMTALEQWFEQHGVRRDGKVIIDVAHAISKLSECTVEIAEMPDDRSSRRRAFRFAHDALDANLKSQRSGKLVPLDIPAEH